MIKALASKLNALPLITKVLVGAGIVLIAYLAIAGGVSTMWARHLANKALRGIASTISDIDKVEADAASKDQAIEALARQTQELEDKAAQEHQLRVQAQAESQALRYRAQKADAEAERLRQADLSRVPVTTLEGARDAINRALAQRRPR